MIKRCRGRGVLPTWRQHDVGAEVFSRHGGKTMSGQRRSPDMAIKRCRENKINHKQTHKRGCSMFTQKVIQTDRGQFEIFIRGRGEPLAFTHLYSEFNENGDIMPQHLSEHYKVYIVNLRGAGKRMIKLINLHTAWTMRSMIWRRSGRLVVLMSGLLQDIQPEDFWL